MLGGKLVPERGLSLTGVAGCYITLNFIYFETVKHSRKSYILAKQ